MNDWTSRWTHASALALTARTRRPLFHEPRAARLLRDCLRDAVLRCDLPLLGWVALPDALHLVGARGGPLPWPAALGRVKQSFARRLPRDLRPKGPLWRCEVRVRPLAEEDVPRAIAALHEMPVRAGLCPGPEDWPWGSGCQG